MFELAQELITFLLSKTEFTEVMSDRLTPIVSSETSPYPFANYMVKDDPGFTKDADAQSGSLFFYFEKEGYMKCAQFLDVMKPIIKEKYEWLGSDIEFVESDQSFVGIINFNKV
ncbi:hypothetical protein [Flavobacterium algicola]|uniref:hypothetical protein n=1 Tax=Flavobacterium algicola TaxID=556529 RepID=UPI001EFCBE57|nr:hypothetical protein [Flavobacterium algicola]MCG9792484.1 hypothetical protein [Flavobacterium algicola]